MLMDIFDEMNNKIKELPPGNYTYKEGVFTEIITKLIVGKPDVVTGKTKFNTKDVLSATPGKGRTKFYLVCNDPYNCE